MSERGSRRCSARTRQAGRLRAAGVSAQCRRPAAGKAAPGFSARRCYLIPGDSPLGYRLPLDSLAVGGTSADFPYAVSARRPAQPAAGAPAYAQLRQQFQSSAVGRDPNQGRARARARKARPNPSRQIEPAKSAGVGHAHGAERRAARTAALRLHAADRALRTISTSSRPSRPRGGGATGDHRGLRAAARPALLKFKRDARPRRDRGQHPSRARWDQLGRPDDALYEEARLARLSTEKFMLDGRHTGTGGGNHIVLGGATPVNEPVPAPARPAAQPAHLLAQPPVAVVPVLRPVHRPDQPGAARRRGAHDALYELEIAFKQLPRAASGQPPPWLVDRCFRNLLIDVSGNTHRRVLHRQALFARRPTGRLGLLELRAFEMPPHARMSLAQQLLLRALVARFWRAALRAPLVRWGTAARPLHAAALRAAGLRRRDGDAPRRLCLR
jgi:uncharacterized protein (DUF2126 family)